MGLEGLLGRFGLPLVVLACFVEGDSAAALSGAVSHRHLLPPLPLVALAAALGGFLNDQLWFHIGRRGARAAWLARRPEHPAAKRLSDLAARRPVPLALGFRFVWGTRIAVPALLGGSGMAPLRFLALDLVAVALWAGIMTGIGAGLGEIVHRVLGRFHIAAHLGLVLTGSLLALLACGLIVRHLWRSADRRRMR